MGRPLINLAGLRFGLLLVLERFQDPSHYSYWKCLCSCGKVVVVRSDALKRQKSCGCAFREETRLRLTTHGYGGTKIYCAWKNMIDRCYNPRNNHYQYYGARGITVCDEWLNSVEAFARDMGLPPSPRHSLDRINNDLGYYKENCRWATATEQSRNRRNVK